MPVSIQGWLEKAIEPHQEARIESLLGSIVAAVSLATFGRAKGNPEALTLGSRKYVQVLAQTKNIVANLQQQESITDQFLLTVMMLGVYERAVSNYDKKTLLAESFRHQSGTMALLRMRKLENVTATPLDTLARHQVVKQAVLHAVALPEWIQKGADFGEEGVRLGLDGCLIRLALLRNRSQQLWRDAPTLDRKRLGLVLRTLIVDARETDRTLASWAAELPREWIYITQGGSSPGQDVLDKKNGDPERFRYGSTYSLYPDLRHAATWNLYRASRVLAGSIVVKAVACAIANLPHNKEIGEEMLAQQVAARGQIQEYADEICASVPYHFDVLDSNRDLQENSKPRLDQIGARRAYLLTWPLTVCMGAPCIPQQQRRWVSSQILNISKITGNKDLELIANLDQNVNLQGDSHSMSQQRMEETVADA